MSTRLQGTAHHWGRDGVARRARPGLRALRAVAVVVVEDSWHGCKDTPKLSRLVRDRRVPRTRVSGIQEFGRRQVLKVLLLLKKPILHDSKGKALPNAPGCGKRGRH